MHPHEFAEALAKRLAEVGSSLTEPRVRLSTKECRDEIYRDTVEHGGRIEDPFFNLIIAEGTAVFTFFEEPFCVYTFVCDEYALISDTEPFAMVDTDQCREYLATSHGKTEPDLSAPRIVAEHWMELA